MSWIVYALLATVSSAVIGIIDKIVLSKWMAKPIGSFFIFGLVEVSFGFVALAALGFPRLPWPILLLTLITGAALAASSLFYFQALKIDDVSRVMPLYGLTPLMVALFAALFLGEILSLSQYFGILLIVCGALLLTMRHVRKLHWSRGLPWMLLAALSAALGGIATKYLLGTVEPWVVFAYERLGTVLVVSPFLVSGYRAFSQACRDYGARVFTFTILSEAISSLSTLFFIFAAAGQYISIVNALLATHPFFLLLFTVLFSLFLPSVLHEKHEATLILRKLAAIACMFVGTLLVT